MPELPPDVDETIRRALQEDVGAGDVTTESVVPGDLESTGGFVAKAPGVVAGVTVARRVVLTRGVRHG